MKKQTIQIALILLSFIFTHIRAAAQGDNFIDGFMKVESFAGMPTDNATHLWKSVPLPLVPGKVIRTFDGLFDDANSIQWSSLKNMYLAEFVKGDCKSRAVFHKNGYMQYAVIRGDENSLPKEVWNVVKANYADYTIGTVNQVRANKQTAWLVNLKGEKDYVVVRVVDRMLDEYSRHSTQPQVRRKGRVTIPN